jgi:hypothetical protein
MCVTPLVLLSNSFSVSHIILEFCLYVIDRGTKYYFQQVPRERQNIHT